jgi:hypothetical protein
VTSPIDPIGVALHITRLLDNLGIANTIGGSIAASFAGEPRASLDIDIVAALEEQRLRELVAALETDFYVDEDALRRAIRAKSSANLVHHATQLKVEIFIAGGTPLDTQQLSRRQRVDVGGGRILHIHPPEDILLQKVRWYRDDREISDRQLRDILGIVRTQGARLDRGYLQRNAAVLGVQDLLARVFTEAEEA